MGGGVRGRGGGAELGAVLGGEWGGGGRGADFIREAMAGSCDV